MPSATFPFLIELVCQFFPSLFIYQCHIWTSIRLELNFFIAHLYFHKLSFTFYFRVFHFSWVDSIFHLCSFFIFLLSAMHTLVTFLTTIKSSFSYKWTFLIITAITRIYITGKFFFILFLFDWIYFWRHVAFYNPHVMSKIFYSLAFFCDHLQTDFRILFKFRQNSRSNFVIFRHHQSLYKNQAFEYIECKFF